MVESFRGTNKACFFYWRFCLDLKTNAIAVVTRLLVGKLRQNTLISSQNQPRRLTFSRSEETCQYSSWNLHVVPWTTDQILWCTQECDMVKGIVYLVMSWFSQTAVSLLPAALLTSTLCLFLLVLFLPTIFRIDPLEKKLLILKTLSTEMHYDQLGASLRSTSRLQLRGWGPPALQ